MKNNDKLNIFMNKIKKNWEAGKIQRSSRITYDVVWNIVLTFLILSFIGMFFALGVGAGYFASLVKDEDVRSYESMEKDIYNYEETSKMYFDNEEYIADIRSDIHREKVSLDDISETLIQAVIATEDENFNEHNGVVPKAIVRAMLQEVTNADRKTGGSTLTQQLIKNQVLTNEVSFERKAKEILLAMRIEHFFSKDEILEAYLNIIPYGRKSTGENIAGIQTAATGVFGIDAKDLNLPQAAFLAGLPQSPSVYTPYVSGGGLKEDEDLEHGKKRMQSVLNRMYQAKYISEGEYEEALAYDIKDDFIIEKKAPKEKYRYLIDELEQRATEIIKEQLIIADDLDLEEVEENSQLNEKYVIKAERELRTQGYNIHSTINKEMYDRFQEIADNYEHYGPNRPGTDEPVQAGAVLRENKSGKILSFVGGRSNFDSEYNHATQAKRSVGSTSKPIAVYAPAMELGAVQPGSIIADLPMSYPKNYGGGNYGLITARDALANSYNVPAYKTYQKIIDQNPVDKYLRKMGITSLDESDEHNLALALGGMKHGITVEENINAFTTLANNGKFVDGYMIEKITDSSGETIYEHEAEEVEIFSPQTAYLTIDMMRDVLSSGTGKYVNTRLKYGGVDWAGKTGTSTDYHDAWFVGLNPNVSLATWIGYDNPASIFCSNCGLSYSQRTQNLWGQLINAAGDVDKELIAPSERFSQPEGIVHRSFCATSGLIPTELCEKAGLVQSDIFNAKFVPKKEDNSLIDGESHRLVVVNGKEVPAGPDTPEEFTSGEGFGLAFNPEFLKENNYDTLGDLSLLFPRKNRELWEKIGTAEGTSDSDTEVEDTGKAPDPPSSLSISGSKLSWSASGSKNVVGYRVFWSESEDGSFTKIGHNTDASLSISKKTGYVHIKAVDYFGRESAPSDILLLGEKEDEEDDDDDKDEEEKPEKDDNDDDDSNTNEDENDSDGESGDNDSNDEDEQPDEPDE